MFQTRVERKVAGATSLPSLEGNQQIRSRSERKGNISTQLRNIDVNTRRQKVLKCFLPEMEAQGQEGLLVFTMSLLELSGILYDAHEMLW